MLCVAIDMTDLRREIAVSRRRIESWSKEFTQQLKSEIDRFSIYVKDQCDLHKFRIFEELDGLQNRLLESQSAIEVEESSNTSRYSSSSLTPRINVKTEIREVDESPKKRTRQATKIYSPESQKKTTRGRKSSSSSDLENSRNSATRSLRKKSRVSYTYNSGTENSDEELEQDISIISKSSDNFHQLLTSNIGSHLISSTPVASPAAPPHPPLPCPPIQLSQSRAPPPELLEVYQSQIMKLLTTPAPQKFQFRHYQDIYYLWGGYHQTRPYAMSYKLLMDLLHFFSDQHNYDGKSNTRYMRQAIYNLIRSGDLVLLDSTDESSVFISLDDDKECISAKLMIALPVSQKVVRKHLKDDREVIDELSQLFYDIYSQLLSDNPSTGTAESGATDATPAPPPAAVKSETGNINEREQVCLLDIQREFIAAVQAGKCRALSERYPNNEGAANEDKISWKYYLPPNEHWRRYRRYEMVDLEAFHKYLEAQKFILVTKTAKSEFIQWIGGEEEEQEQEEWDGESGEVWESI
jgi:hypothetical protein